ncbi:MAG: flagellar basal-body rod protein FlgF [Blastocatellia bacterium]|nr:flagellar basal-body rod protein FlgF [Blastocatellia bacterium]
MNPGLYAAYLGMRVRIRALDVMANNIANASTTGFKADRLFYRSLEAREFETERRAAQDNLASTQDAGQDTGELGAERRREETVSLRALGVVAGGMMDFAAGSLRETGRPLDIALAGDGFLAIQTPRGERYTRSGSLTLDAAGQLVTLQGDLVIGEGGPITVKSGEISIGEDGRITAGGQEMGRLKLMQFQNPGAALLKEGDALFAPTGSEPPLPATQTRVQQGMLESSNVNPVGEMAAMIQNNREFESLQRSVTLMMSMHKIASEIGKI